MPPPPWDVSNQAELNFAIGCSNTQTAASVYTINAMGIAPNVAKGVQVVQDGKIKSIIGNYQYTGRALRFHSSQNWVEFRTRRD